MHILCVWLRMHILCVWLRTVAEKAGILAPVQSGGIRVTNQTRGTLWVSKLTPDEYR